jgi:hypothetical protein
MDRTETFNKEEMSGHEPQTGLDTRADRLTDRQSQCDFDFVTLEHRAPVKRFVSLQSVGLLERGISPSQGRYLHEHKINAHRHAYLEWDMNPRSQC